MKKTKQAWREAKQYSSEEKSIARIVLNEIMAGEAVMKAIHNHPLNAGGYIAKHMLIAAYQELVEGGYFQNDPTLLARSG
jgi:hypothetical protein